MIDEVYPVKNTSYKDSLKVLHLMNYNFSIKKLSVGVYRQINLLHKYSSCTLKINIKKQNYLLNSRNICR